MGVRDIADRGSIAESVRPIKEEDIARTKLQAMQATRAGREIRDAGYALRLAMTPDGYVIEAYQERMKAMLPGQDVRVKNALRAYCSSREIVPYRVDTTPLPNRNP